MKTTEDMHRETMEYQTLHNGIRMPADGFGTWDVRGKTGENIIRTALDTGYRLIDTAQMYDNEGIVGKAVRESGIPRRDIFVTTKLSRPLRNGRRDCPQHFRFPAAARP